MAPRCPRRSIQPGIYATPVGSGAECRMRRATEWPDRDDLTGRAALRQCRGPLKWKWGRIRFRKARDGDSRSAYTDRQCFGGCGPSGPTAGVDQSSRAVWRDVRTPAYDDAFESAAHGLRRGDVPEHWGVLGIGNGNVLDDGRCLHSFLWLL